MTGADPMPDRVPSPSRSSAGEARGPIVYHLGSGGFVHQLNVLGNSFVFSRAFGATLVPILDANPEWGIPFHRFFRPLAPEFATPEEHDILVGEIGRNLGLPIADARSISFSWSPDVPEAYVLTGDLAGASSLGLDWRNGPGGAPAVLTAGTPRAPEGIPWGWPAVIGQLALQRWVAEELALRVRALPDRFVGVHFRNTDISSDLRQVADAARAAAHAHGVREILWATDDADSREEAAALLPGFRVFGLATPPSVRAIPGGALHFLPPDRLREAGLTKTGLLLESLADMLALIRAEAFIPSGNSTGWTGFVETMRSIPMISDQFFGLAPP